MANTGIFITKPGVVKPSVTEMALASWQSYANNLTLPLLASSGHEFRAFEAFKYRLFSAPDDIGVDANFVSYINLLDNRNLQFLVGTGQSPQVAGQITLLTAPAQIEALNTVFLENSRCQLVGDDDMGLGFRVTSIDGQSYIHFDFDTGDWTVVEDGVENVGEGGSDVPVTTNEIHLRVEEAAIEIYNADLASIIYSYPRLWRASRTAGSNITLDSTGTDVGDWLGFNATETVDADASVGNSTMLVESNFGQKTNYTVKVGTEIVSSEFAEDYDVEFLAGQAAIHDVKDNFNGGVGTLSYAVIGGSIPTGTTLTSNGLVQGVPTVDGVYNATIRVTDEFGQTANLSYKFTVVAAVNVAYDPPPGVVGIPYNYEPNIVGIAQVELLSGLIPTGLTLDLTNGNLTGTPSAAGVYAFTIKTDLLQGGGEVIDASITVYAAMVAEGIQNGDSLGAVDNLSVLEVNQNQTFVFLVTGGSGQYQFSITGENTISSNGEVQFYETGLTTITVVDTVTGQTLTFVLLVAGQGDICGMVVEDEGGEESANAPCVDVITDCNTPVSIAFNSMQLLRGISAGETPYREYPSFDTFEGASVQNNGKAFVLWRATASNGYGVANNARDGKPFILEFAAHASVVNTINDVAVGIARKFQNQSGLGGLDFAMVITTVGADRVVEIRKSNVYQSGSRFPIEEGQQLGFAVYPNTILLYVDGILRYTLTSNTFGCSGLELVFFSQDANVLVGGRADNIIYSIESPGTPQEVGTIDAQSGLYTPSLQNVSLVRIAAVSTANDDIKYTARVRVIRPAIKASLERALIEGVNVDIWVAESERFDELPLRLDRNGRPDKNQVKNPRHLGILAGAGRIEVTPTRTEFRNDVGATSSSLTFDKAVVTGAFLHIRDFALVKSVIPFMREYNSHGIRQLKQFSTGCHKRMRVMMVWQSPDCEDVPVYDAIEIPNGLSYTTFNLEIGKGVQSNIPLTVEGFPNSDGVLFEYNQYDKAFNRIGS